ncbi:MAG: GGDEF domain-containing protein, partial [Treponema sp.]|jgi:diguanylate cyclase (GGDEF)-like protein|nr:GGDEF domain-containing protein [Treponema sp.]
MSLMMLDLDRVHAINDRYGVSAGDMVITAVAEILRTQMRPGDVVARLSGDEFAVLLPDTGSKDAVHIAERIRESVCNHKMSVPKAPGLAERAVIETRTSIGVAVAPTHADNEKSLVYTADRALRKAKNLGRNRVELADG